MQFAMLIGYSVSGAGDIIYFDLEMIKGMYTKARKLVRKKKKKS